MRLKDLLCELRSALESAGFEAADFEGSLIVSRVSGIPHLELPLHRGRAFSQEELSSARAMLARRLAREPLQYILGDAQFRDLLLKVGPGVLVPRMETEQIVDLVKERLPFRGALCELGVGSGAISLAVATERPDVKVCGSEISPEALRWAEMNRRELSAANVRFLQGDLFAPFEGLSFDVVVANLPYIASWELPILPADVRDHEPEAALISGSDGLDAIRRAIAEAPRFLKPGGCLILEMGETQGPAIAEIFAASGLYSPASIRNDSYGAERFAEASLKLV